jgi:DNA-binding winged helix-turn-helix (wHTH) protein
MSKPNTVDSSYDIRVHPDDSQSLFSLKIIKSKNLSVRTAKRYGYSFETTKFDNPDERTKADKRNQKKSHSAKLVQVRLQAKLKQRAESGQPLPR